MFACYAWRGDRNNSGLTISLKCQNKLFECLAIFSYLFALNISRNIFFHTTLHCILLFIRNADISAIEIFFSNADTNPNEWLNHICDKWRASVQLCYGNGQWQWYHSYISGSLVSANRSIYYLCKQVKCSFIHGMIKNKRWQKQSDTGTHDLWNVNNNNNTDHSLNFIFLTICSSISILKTVNNSLKIRVWLTVSCHLQLKMP